MIVADCSIIISGYFSDENSDISNDFLTKIENQDLSIIVPRLFLIEVKNVVVSSYRRGRITKLQFYDYIKLFTNIGFIVDDESNLEICAELAIEYDLSLYDAIYLELAIRKNIKLATLDNKLARAAKKLNITYDI